MIDLTFALLTLVNAADIDRGSGMIHRGIDLLLFLQIWRM